MWRNTPRPAICGMSWRRWLGSIRASSRSGESSIWILTWIMGRVTGTRWFGRRDCSRGLARCWWKCRMIWTSRSFTRSMWSCFRGLRLGRRTRQAIREKAESLPRLGAHARLCRGGLRRMCAAGGSRWYAEQLPFIDGSGMAETEYGYAKAGEVGDYGSAGKPDFEREFGGGNGYCDVARNGVERQSRNFAQSGLGGERAREFERGGTPRGNDRDAAHGEEGLADCVAAARDFV